MVLLLSVFNHGTIIVKKKFDEEQKQIGIILQDQLKRESQSAGLAKFIENSSKALNESEKLIEVKLQLLNPKRQIIRMFIILFTALIFAMGNMLVRDTSLGWYNHILSLSLLGASGLVLLYAMYVLYQVGCVIIDTKTIIEEERLATSLHKES